VVKGWQFFIFFMFMFFMFRPLKVGEVAVKTTEARLAPGCTVEYSITLLSLISCNCCTCVRWVYSVVQLGLSHNNFCKYTGRKQSRMDRFQNKINGTHLVGAQVYSVVQLDLGHGHTNKTCQTPLPSTVELRLHSSSLPDGPVSE
jgi:hypothetical protein